MFIPMKSEDIKKKKWWGTEVARARRCAALVVFSFSELCGSRRLCVCVTERDDMNHAERFTVPGYIMS